AARVADEILGHGDMPLRLGRVAVGESAEMGAELRLVARLSSRNELTHLQVVQKSRGRVLCCDAAGKGQNCDGGERQGAEIDGSHGGPTSLVTEVTPKLCCLRLRDSDAQDIVYVIGNGAADARPNRPAAAQWFRFGGR